MASYQIPQFLDSGDKILLSMNLRQLGYAIGFGFFSFLIVQLSITIFPGGGWLNFIPAVPFALFGAYLSLGKYNSRDSEVYVLASIIYFLKPRKLLYVRIPDLYDLEEKLGMVSAQAVAKKMKERVDQKSKDSNKLLNFDSRNRQDKAKRIIELANMQDSIATQTREKIIEMDIQRDTVLQQIKRSELINRNNGSKPTQQVAELFQNNYQSSPILNQSNNPNLTSTQTPDQNFFNINE